MNKMQINITEDNNSFEIIIDTQIYSQEAVNATCYKYTDKFFVQQRIIDNSGVVVSMEVKDKKNPISELDLKQFCNDLLDQQVRVDVNNRFGHIRDLIVEEAFKPVNK